MSEGHSGWGRTQFEDLQPELVEPLRLTTQIAMAYLGTLRAVVPYIGRDPNFPNNHLLTYFVHDLIESCSALMTLSMEGMQRPFKRELRFILEASAKLCLVQQKSYDSSVEQKLEEYGRELRSPSLAIKRGVKLELLPSAAQEAFVEEVGRLYGKTSDYVHWTPVQIRSRIAAMTEGRTAGFETADEVSEINDLLSRVLAASLVLIFHSAPYWVAGDFLVSFDDEPPGAWYFARSRFLSALDSEFDYKAERKNRLPELQSARLAFVAF